MRILYLCWLDPATTDVPLFIADAWRKVGHEVEFVLYDLECYHGPSGQLWHYLSGGDERIRHVRTRRLLERKCRQFRPDVLIMGATLLPPQTISRLRKRFGFHFGFFLGYNHCLVGFTSQLLAMADFVLVHDTYLLPLLRGSRDGRNQNVFHIPSAADPREHFPVVLSDTDVASYKSGVAFIGGVSSNRIEGLRCVADLGLRVWGDSRWAKVPEIARYFSAEPVYGLKKTKIYAAADIVLNIEDEEKQINAFSQRIPEVLLSGGFVLTSHQEDLRDTPFLDGQSIAVYYSLDDLSDKARYYFAHPQERERISTNGRAVVLSHFTYDRVMTPVVDEIERLVELCTLAS